MKKEELLKLVGAFILGYLFCCFMDSQKNIATDSLCGCPNDGTPCDCSNPGRCAKEGCPHI